MPGTAPGTTRALHSQGSPGARESSPEGQRTTTRGGSGSGGSWLERVSAGTSLAVQGLGLRAPTAAGAGSIPGRGTKIPHAVGHGQKLKKKSSG